jgi:hypothetical protein
MLAVLARWGRPAIEPVPEPQGPAEHCDLLARPEPQGPTDDELDELYYKSGGIINAFARAVLARWGRPAPPAPEAGEVRELVAWLRNRDRWTQLTDAQVDRAATLLAQQAAPAPVVVPVPVSERPPGPEDCDAEGRCWWFSPPACGPHTIRPCWTFDSETLEGDTHWLPHWALPMPVVEDADG